MSIIERVKNILTTPKTEWQAIAAEPATVGGLYTGYIMILAAIPAIAALISSVIRGALVSGVVMAVLTYVLDLVMVYLVALIINALAPSFGGQKDQIQALKTIAYTKTAAWVAGIALIIPGIGAIISLVASLYGIYLLYLGLPATMKCPPEKTIVYMVVTFLCLFVLSILVGLVLAPLALLLA